VNRITLVRAPNPSPMTLSGTNTYLVAAPDGSAICIDPGPAMELHVAAILERARAEHLRIVGIAITHGHPDHAPAAAALAHATGAPVYAHPASAVPHDRSLRDGDEVRFGEGVLLAYDAPGHTLEHLVFYAPESRTLFSGDTVLGEGYVVVAPPAGAMRPYQRTLERLLELLPDGATIHPGHGPRIADARATVRDYIAHRQAREAELLSALREGPRTLVELVSRIYARTPRALWPAAARQLLAYLIPLEEEGRVRAEPLRRPLEAHEEAVLNPSWETVVGRDHAAVVEAELGAQVRLAVAYRYSLAA